MVFLSFYFINPKKERNTMFKKIMLASLALAAGAIGVKAVKKLYKMPLIGDMAPYFSAQTTQGKVNFPCDYKGKWVVFFSHPADFTSVCTTEIMFFQKYYDEFKKINTELIGLSVDNLESHMSWFSSIKDKIKYKGLENLVITFPLIDDEKGEIARKYGMLQNDSKTVRAVFVIDPKGVVRAIIYYPQTTGRNLDEILRLTKALQVTDNFEVATPANWQEGDDVIVPTSQRPFQLSEQEASEKQVYCSDWYLCTRPISRDEIENKLNNQN